MGKCFPRVVGLLWECFFWLDAVAGHRNSFSSSSDADNHLGAALGNSPSGALALTGATARNLHYRNVAEQRDRSLSIFYMEGT
jgi:hypothetical protein